jgi:CheY-like chemotaxis protein
MQKPNEPKRIVLYADNDVDDLDFVREAFLQHAKDTELITFESAVQLLRYICDQPANAPSPCLIILDVNMPQMNGRDALKIIRKMDQYHNVPIILFTTSSSPHDEFFADCYNAGFVTKPLNESQMQLIVEKFRDYCSESIKK